MIMYFEIVNGFDYIFKGIYIIALIEVGSEIEGKVV